MRLVKMVAIAATLLATCPAVGAAQSRVPAAGSMAVGGEAGVFVPDDAFEPSPIIGGFFNVGVPTPGSQVGDAIAQVRLFRASSSADPAGLLRVQGLLSICSNADCSGATTVGNIVDLGTVASIEGAGAAPDRAAGSPGRPRPGGRTS
jgi:hypothetical protein